MRTFMNKEQYGVSFNQAFHEVIQTCGNLRKKGDLLLTVDLEKVKAAGYDIITPMLICNTGDYASVEAMAGKQVAAGDDVLSVEEK